MLSKLSCQTYKDSTYAEAVAAGCDAVQLKMDGWWTHIAWRHEQVRLFSKTARNFEVRPAPVDFLLDAIGETMTGTQWAQHPSRKGIVYLFDLWTVNNKDLRQFPYRDRMRKMAEVFKQVPRLAEAVTVVQTFPIAKRDELWKLVEAGKYEGVVYRKLGAVVDEVILREKLVITEQLRIKRINPGQGKHVGRMGSATCETLTGVEVDVGGGWSDSQREEMWADPDRFIGQWIDVEARAKFESGSLRHPNFVSFRGDLS